MTAIETDTKTADDAAQDESGEFRHEDSEQTNEQNITGIVLKGAALGAVSGAAIGALAALATVTWPEKIEQAKAAVSENARGVGRDAARAAAQTFDPSIVADLMPGKDDRAEAVKRAARDAATAATKAARETISTKTEEAH